MNNEILTFYSNVAHIIQSANDFVIKYSLAIPKVNPDSNKIEPEIVKEINIVTSPQQFKKILLVFEEQLKMYEKKFGEMIRKEIIDGIDGIKDASSPEEVGTWLEGFIGRIDNPKYRYIAADLLLRNCPCDMKYEHGDKIMSIYNNSSSIHEFVYELEHERVFGKSIVLKNDIIYITKPSFLIKMCPPKAEEMKIANEILSFNKCNISIQELQEKYPQYMIRNFDISLYSLKTLKNKITDILDDAHKSNFKNKNPYSKE